MIFIGLDVSKISTALCIENNGDIMLFNYTTAKDGNVWVKSTNEYINYRHFNYKYLDEKEYSKKELLKLIEFDEVTDLIINDIFDNVDLFDNVKIAIEGFSYNSKGPIYDLIEFTTILKHKMLHKLNAYSSIHILSPYTLKTETCKMVYEPRIELKGKRVIKEILHNENTSGKEATKFDKWDMFYAFVDSNIDMNFKEWCINYKDSISNKQPKEVPKPIDDVIDAIFLKEVIKNN